MEVNGSSVHVPHQIDPQYEFSAPQYVDFLSLNENAFGGEDKWFDDQEKGKEQQHQEEEDSFIQPDELLEMQTVEIFEGETITTINENELKISDLIVPERKKPNKTQSKPEKVDAKPSQEVRKKSLEFLKNKKQLPQRTLEEKERKKKVTVEKEKVQKVAEKPKQRENKKRRGEEEKHPTPNKRIKPTITNTTTTTKNNNNNINVNDVKLKDRKTPQTKSVQRENASKSKPFHFGEPTVINNNNNNNDDNDNNSIALTTQPNQPNPVSIDPQYNQERNPHTKQTVDKKPNTQARIKSLTLPKSPSFMHRAKPKILSTEERQLQEILQAKKALREHIRFGKPLSPPPHPVLKKQLHKTLPVEKSKNKTVITNNGDNKVRSVIDNNKENEVNHPIAPKQQAAQKPLRWRM